MHLLTVLIILVVSFADYLAELHVVPKEARFLPELLSFVVTICVVFSGTRQRFANLAGKYWFTFGAIAVVIVCGIIANAVEPGPIVAGIRYYLRAAPLFFLAAVANFTQKQRRQQLLLLLGLSLLQLPIAAYQRLTVFAQERFTGDAVYGTLGASGFLSIFQIGVACALTALATRRAIKPVAFMLLFFLVLLPTTINETKVTIIFLPIALIGTVIFAAPRAIRVRATLWTTILMVLFGGIFVPVYDYYNTKYNPYPETIEDFATNTKRMERYVDTGAGVGSRKEAGRVDAIAVPLERLSQDPVNLVLGLGIGNASKSNLGPQFTGRYFALYGRYTIESSAAAFLLETGLLGLLLLLLLNWFIFHDALAVARADAGRSGALAGAWAAFTMVMVISLFYVGVHISAPLAYLFFYFSGLVAAERMRLAPSTVRGNYDLAPHRAATRI